MIYIVADNINMKNMSDFNPLNENILGKINLLQKSEFAYFRTSI